MYIESNSPVGAELQNSREFITVCSPASGKVLPGPRGASSPQNIDGFSRVKQQRPPPAFPSPLPCATRLQHDISRAGSSTPRSPGWWLRGGERRQNICGGPSWVRTHRPLLLRTRLLLSAGRGPRLPGPAKVAFAHLTLSSSQPQEKFRNSPRGFQFESLFRISAGRLVAPARGKLGRRRSERCRWSGDPGRARKRDPGPRCCARGTGPLEARPAGE